MSAGGHFAKPKSISYAPLAGISSTVPYTFCVSLGLPVEAAKVAASSKELAYRGSFTGGGVALLASIDPGSDSILINEQAATTLINVVL
jgi:hypothetical protein